VPDSTIGRITTGNTVSPLDVRRIAQALERIAEALEKLVVDKPLGAVPPDRRQTLEETRGAWKDLPPQEER
jgi:hypothetical protein